MVYKRFVKLIVGTKRYERLIDVFGGFPVNLFAPQLSLIVDILSTQCIDAEPAIQSADSFHYLNRMINHRISKRQMIIPKIIAKYRFTNFIYLGMLAQFQLEESDHDSSVKKFVEGSKKYKLLLHCQNCKAMKSSHRASATLLYKYLNSVLAYLFF